MQIDGYTRLAAVVANPIKHSLSPFIHNMAFEQTQTNGVYVAWEIEQSDLEVTLANVRRYQMFGLNISMPYKQVVIPYLDKLDPLAELIGVVNTVVLEDNQLVGYNTDGYGFFRSLQEQVGFDCYQKRLLILGSGSTSKSIIAQAAFSGAFELIIFTKKDYMTSTSEFLACISSQTGVKTQLYDLSEATILSKKLEEVELFVNTTRFGMDGQSLPISEKTIFPSQLLVADVIYQPFETPLLALARRQGLITVNGLGMLLYQAAESFRLWTGQEMPTVAIWQALQEKCQIKK